MVRDDSEMLGRSRTEPGAWTASSEGGVVATAHYRATWIAADVLRAGGNAIDAAVAASLALGVCEPAGSGLGGMVMMLVHLAREGRTLAIEGPCRAPRRADPEVVARSPRKHGPRSIAVPTAPAVLAHALRRHGTLDEPAVLGPAIALATEGHVVSKLQWELARTYRKNLARDGGGLVFLDAEKSPHAPGTLLRQPELARTLTRLAEGGLESFYTGEVAAGMAADLEQRGAFIRIDDLEDVPWPIEREPLGLDLDDWRAITLAPPAGGVTLLEMLRFFFELDDIGQGDPDTPHGARLIAEIIRRAREDRRRHRLHLVDGAGEVVARLLDRDAARETVRELVASVPARAGEGETTHVSVIDREGNAVALTQSIERCWGSKVLTPSLGFLYNGYLRAFKVKNRKHPHFLRPGAVARSNACPVIVLRDGGVHLVMGSTGSERMASGIFEVLARLRLGRSPFEAVHAPRLHCTPEGVVMLERDRFTPEALDELVAAGLELQKLRAYSFKVGGLQLAVRENGICHGVADPRRDGAADGP